MRSSNLRCAAAGLVALALLASACTADSADAEDDGSDGSTSEPIDYKRLGLWDDGPCDDSREPLVVGLMTVFESPVLPLIDHPQALEAAAAGFNELLSRARAAPP